MRVCGVDDAGRGPVIGPLVIAGITIDEKKIDELRSLGVKDSKMLIALLEAKVMAQVIEKLKPDVAYVDSSDTRTDRFKNNILDRLTFTPRIVSEHKADINYAVVSAASIMAKVRRDTRIDELKRQYGEIGSGYAHDPATARFLRDYYSKHGDFPPIVRRSWKTLRNIVADLAQTSLV
ncbi:ribonuclease HII [archaeon 13_2_20CM_2_53_6]|nr:MAG: ribonuclease HII [archaeon 13_2_20CM_2_53_6]